MCLGFSLLAGVQAGPVLGQVEAAARCGRGEGSPWCQEVVEDQSGQQHSSHTGQGYHAPGILEETELWRNISEVKFRDACGVFVSVTKCLKQTQNLISSYHLGFPVTFLSSPLHILQLSASEKNIKKQHAQRCLTSF